jgi:hypothetical protein
MRDASNPGYVPATVLEDEEKRAIVNTTVGGVSGQRIMKETAKYAHGINCSAFERVWRIDVAMSRAFAKTDAAFAKVVAEHAQEYKKFTAPALLHIMVNADDESDFEVIRSVELLYGDGQTGK